jgi:NAD(P)-dependent dehydrogenase (short-subunit alcohol dehydrogenase family)
LDVTDYSQWEDIVANAKDKFGKVHMVINNAGVGGTPGKVEDSEHETWRWVMDVNVMGGFTVRRLAFQPLKSMVKAVGC